MERHYVPFSQGSVPLLRPWHPPKSKKDKVFWQKRDDVDALRPIIGLDSFPDLTTVYAFYLYELINLVVNEGSHSKGLFPLPSPAS